MDKESMSNLNKEKMDFLASMDPMLREYIVAVASEVSTMHIKALRQTLKLTHDQEDAFDRYLDFGLAALPNAIVRNFAAK